MSTTDSMIPDMLKSMLERFERGWREVPRGTRLIYQELRSSEDKRGLWIDNSCTNSTLSLMLGRNKLLRGKTWFVWGDDDNNKEMHSAHSPCPFCVDSRVIHISCSNLTYSVFQSCAEDVQLDVFRRCIHDCWDLEVDALIPRRILVRKSSTK